MAEVDECCEAGAWVGEGLGEGAGGVGGERSEGCSRSRGG